MNPSAQTKLISGILLLTVPTIQYGGSYLLKLLTSQDRAYINNPLRQGMFRAGHAHAGVLVILSLLCQLLADAAAPAPDWALWIARLGTPLAAILIPARLGNSYVPAGGWKRETVLRCRGDLAFGRL